MYIFLFIIVHALYITVMQSNTTIVSIAAVFLVAAAIITATHGQKKTCWHLSKVILSCINNYEFETIK